MFLNCSTRNAFLFILLQIGVGSLFAQSTHYVTTNSTTTSGGLGYEIANASSGDIIEISNDITISSEISISKTLTINGNGNVVSVQEPGVSNEGTNASNPSSYSVFNTSGNGVTITIEDITLMGGNVLSSTKGACITNSANKLILNRVTITRGRSFSSSSRYGAGGMYNGSGATAYLNDCQIIRNSAGYGGGFVNRGTMYIESTTFSENRSENSSGGGGGCENQGTLYMNNCTFSNNKSTEIGGGINNYTGTLYIANCTFTGNVAYGNYKGGAVGNNSGTVYAVNCIFAYNYYRSGSGSVSNPLAFTLDDFGYATGCNIYYSIYHSSINTFSTNTGNIQYTGDDDGSDNDMFAGGTYTKLTDGTGTEIGTAKVFQPYLVSNSTKTATLQIGSFPNKSANKGVVTGYTDGGGSPSMGYKNPSTGSWVNIVGSSASSNQVTVDQLDTARASSPTRGSIESEINTVYMLKVLKPTNGSTTGGSLYGDIYESGDQATLTASPASGYAFDYWKSTNTGNSVSTDNPWTITINSDSTVEAVFVTSSNYSVIYNSNNATAGEAPSSQTFSSGGSVTISNQNTLYRDEYYFDGWNTSATGTGTDYSAGNTYSTTSNLTLYAKWVPYIKYYPKSGSVSSLNNTSSWSGTKDGSGGSPTNFNSDKIFILTNSSGSTSFTTSGNWSVDGAIQIPEGATLTISANSTTTLSNDITNNGVILGLSGSTLVLDGTTRQYLNGTNILQKFESKNDDGISLLDSTVILNALTLTDGTLYTNGELTFRSSSTQTAILNSIASGAAISGNVRVEQYIPAKRAFRLLSPTVTTTTSIYENWQENGRSTNGLGTHITGSKTGANGFDATNTGNASLYTFNNGTGSWAKATNTNTNTLSAGVPYRLMVRGDRNISLNSNDATPSNTTLRAIGTLATGTKTFNFGNSSSGNNLFVGNPYQAPVDMATVINTNGTNVDDDYYIWDPNLSTRGAYVSINATTGNTTNGSSDVDKFLQPGQACFMISTGSNASVSFTEAAKGTSITSTWRTTTPDAGIDVQLFSKDSFHSGAKSCDGVSLYFSDEYNSGIDFGDVTKYGNLDETISWDVDGKTFIKQERKLPTIEDIIPLKAQNYRSSDYVFKINYNGSLDLDIYLKDNVLNKLYEIVTGENILPFDVNVTNGKDANRFEFVFASKTNGIPSIHRNTFRVFPNPVNEGTIQITGLNANEFVQLELIDAAGRTVWNIEGNYTGNYGLPKTIKSGYFQLRISTRNKAETHPVLIH